MRIFLFIICFVSCFDIIAQSINDKEHIQAVKNLELYAKQQYSLCKNNEDTSNLKVVAVYQVEADYCNWNLEKSDFFTLEFEKKLKPIYTYVNVGIIPRVTYVYVFRDSTENAFFLGDKWYCVPGGVEIYRNIIKYDIVKMYALCNYGVCPMSHCVAVNKNEKIYYLRNENLIWEMKNLPDSIWNNYKRDFIYDFDCE